MSVVGCYSLDLYCRFDGMSHGTDASRVRHSFNYFPHQFIGETFADCKKQAKLAGWTFQRDGDATCPRCSKWGPEKSNEKGERAYLPFKSSPMAPASSPKVRAAGRRS